MRIELKGLLMAVLAAVVVLGATFGVSALVRHGQAAPPSAPASTTPAPGGPDRSTSAASVVQGHQFYTQSCASCHGPDGKGGFGPKLHNEDMSDTRMTQVIQKGKGRMPGFRTTYNVAQTQALVAYIRSLK